MLHRLENEYEGVDNDDDLAMVLRLLAQDADREAAADGRLRGFLLSIENKDGGA